MFTFFKSSNSFNYSRSFQKIADCISYIGGLFGAITALLFFIKIYCQYSFEMGVGAALFSNDYEVKGKLKKYNFLSFICQGIFNGAQSLKLSLKWPIVSKYFDCRR
jgi:ABC-type phosphate transport system permease subunit